MEQIMTGCPVISFVNHSYHFLKSGEGNPRYLLLHANGFNGGTYQRLLNCLGEGTWLAPDFRGHGQSYDPGHIHSWDDLVEDLARWQNDKLFDRPIAIGHSLGGISALLFEAAHPGSCAGIVLLDPVLFNWPTQVVLWLLESRLFRRWHPMVNLTLSRREEFPDVETLKKIYSRKPAFRTWQSEVLDDYLKWGTRPANGANGGIRLSCRKEIEAEIFANWPDHVWKALKNVQCPVLLLRGAESRTFVPQAMRAALRRLPQAHGMNVEGGGHFLPMEQPEKVAQAIQDWEKTLTGSIKEHLK
ncbi:alpha/beta hydrolase [Bdellovibrionota bacterium FG-2]